MLEKPDLPEEEIIACIQKDYGLDVRHLVFLPRGADVNAAVYRLQAGDGKTYFAKLKRGKFTEIASALSRFLRDQGIEQIIAPLWEQSGQLWERLRDYRLILYPFVVGCSGFEVVLSPRQWAAFGSALKRVHTARLPVELETALPRERYSPQFREQVKRFLEEASVGTYDEPVAVQVAALLREKEALILDLIQRAERLAAALQAQSPEHVLCHSDSHAGNILIAEDGALYLVDWDEPILAPKERDLMYIGGAQGFQGVTAQEEERLFYQGYGPAVVNQAALAYYRYERIIQDIAAFCEQLLLTSEGGEDRQQSFGYLASNFQPGGTVEMAYRAENSGKAGGVWHDMA
jgi:spectinomycin phosphotransferase